MVTKVTIVGGYGGMGQIFTRLFKEDGCDVTITGPTETKGKDISKKLGVKYSKDNKRPVSKSDVVVVTVPIAYTADTIKEVGPHMKKGALFMDLTSVKGWPCDLMLKHSKKSVEVIGTHPIFGPRVGTIEGQVIVLTPVRGGKWLGWLKGLLAENKAKIIESTPKEHDQVMGVVQGLTHFAYISVAKTLLDMGIDVKRSRDFSSPVYDLMLDMIGRIIGQNPYLYAEIQIMNPEVVKIHEHYLNACRELSESVSSGDEKSFVKMMSAAARHFGDTERAMGRSDKAIGSLVSELNELKDSVGKEVCLKHIYSGTKHLGIVKSVDPDFVSLSYKGKISKLKLSNLKILGDAEKFSYMAEKYGLSKKDFSLIYADGTDEMLLADILRDRFPYVQDVAVKDIFRSNKIGDGKKSICLSVEFIKSDVKKKNEEIMDFLKRLGGCQR